MTPCMYEECALSSASASHKEFQSIVHKGHTLRQIVPFADEVGVSEESIMHTHDRSFHYACIHCHGRQICQHKCCKGLQSFLPLSMNPRRKSTCLTKASCFAAAISGARFLGCKDGTMSTFRNLSEPSLMHERGLATSTSPHGNGMLVEVLRQSYRSDYRRNT
jgi:hypothetical protein